MAATAPVSASASPEPARRPVLKVESLRIAIGDAAIVDGVSLDLRDGELLALVGESGCGKSLTALALMGLLPPVAQRISGAIRLGGRDLAGEPESALRRIRGRDMAMIFQEPMSSLNPLMRVGPQVMESLIVHGSVSPETARARALDMLASVGIRDPELRFGQYPFELSGGLCQRVMIAMALITGPRLVIADEPTTALDVTIQAQILALLKRLQEETGTAVLLITHDMGVVAETADRVATMYAGRIVEEGSVLDVFERPRHPYTKLLLLTIPRVDDPHQGELRTIEGSVPSIADWPSGCRFRTRCPLARAKCADEPPFVDVEGDGHRAACWFTAEVEGLA